MDGDLPSPTETGVEGPAAGPEIEAEPAPEVTAAGPAWPPRRRFETPLTFEEKVVRAFIRGGKLVSIPAPPKKRDVILHWLVERCFPDAGPIPEPEVNRRLAEYNEDVAALRRYMVLAGLVTRAGGEYRRVAGAEDVAQAGPRGNVAGSSADAAATRSIVLVLMGVAGSGKSTVMAALAARLGWPCAEADEFHSPENVAKMASGIPLTDEDRRPWLLALAAWIGEREAARGGAGENSTGDTGAGESGLMTCSALKRSYRDLLRDGHPSVRFVYLEVAPAELAARLAARKGHYMAPSMLAGQLEILEPLAPDEPGIRVSAAGGVELVTAAILGWLRAEGRAAS